MPSTYAELEKQLKISKRKHNFDKIKSAYEYATEMHEGQFRKSGEPYITHPIAVAIIVAELGLDSDSVCAALLHDTIEDCRTKTNLDILSEKFGKDVAELVDGLTKFTDIQFENKEYESIENLRKMFLAMSKDIRVIFIKLADRLHNMRTLNAKSEKSQRSIALETMHVYAPLAHRLGIQKIKNELENLALKYLDPIGYEEVRRDVEYKYGESKQFLNNTKDQIIEKLKEMNIKFKLEGRVKSIYSIYKKMYNQNKSFDEIYDFYAIRVIVDTELECYTVLGIIHEMFNLVPGRFKDYISTPKPNMYRSLHTTVIGRKDVPIEVQIRTWEMHEVAEYGIAAHWKYKSGDTDKENIAEKLKWIKTLVENESDDSDPDEFLRPLKIDLFEDEIFIFTPKGDVINLPVGSNAIDFAYSIHSQVGNKMIGAKVNGVIVPIDTELQTGQICEVVTSSSSKGPSRDWLKIVKTSEAKNKIRQYFKKEKRDENIVEGRTDVDREFKRFAKTYDENLKNEAVENVAKRAGFTEVDDFYNNIGYGGLSLSRYIARLKDEYDRLFAEKESKNADPTEAIVTTDKDPLSEIKREKKNASDATQSVIVDSIDNCQVRFAKCCNPLPGDNIIGYVTRGFGVSVHKYDCPNAIEGLKKPEERDRWITVRWSRVSLEQGENTTGTFETLIKIYATNSLNIYADISSVFADLRVPVHTMNSKETSDGDIIISLTVSCKNASHVNLIVERLKKIKDVIDVTRGFS
ncbi:MAG: bifunctional (p)ppGpp synthetase/guanosine-3',5'-bis(diphosphate) 3'-pyrophosphohydrolase [Clostridia bacterium]|nr:bifunctional (p)ppGpp synthetase/guanosine-3',5'-bis(diphosphate) 3'-pyrophosphohydrolase [Clostridia bacterium]